MSSIIGESVRRPEHFRLPQAVYRFTKSVSKELGSRKSLNSIAPGLWKQILPLT